MREEHGVGDRGPRPRDRRLLWLLLGAGSLRLLLIQGGGGGYWPDESRYDVSRRAMSHLFHGDLPSALAALDSADHFLSKVIGLVPAALEQTLYDRRIPALFFGTFSLVCIALVRTLARRLGASASEALLAAFLLALSSSFFYYSRHWLPYDLALSFALGALCIAVVRTPSARDSWLCGLLSAGCLLTYNGYWTLCVLAGLMHVGWDPGDARVRAGRALRFGLAFAAPPVIVFAANAAAGGTMGTQLAPFLGSVTLGSFAEGGRLPIAYLWHAEHGLLILWIAALVATVWRSIAGTPSASARFALLSVALLYGLLFIGSVMLEQFVVYGRLARQLVPFLCIAAAHELERLRTHAAPAPRRIFALVCAAAIAQAAFNFARPLSQTFPPAFLREASALRATQGTRATRILFAHHLYPVRLPTALPPHDVLLAAEHPLAYLPYQYDGFDPRERALLRATDIRMRVIALRPATAPNDRRGQAR